MNAIVNSSRRQFIKASGGLALGFYLPQSLAQSGPGRTVSTDLAGDFSPNAFIRISSDNTVTVIVKHVEMGQGTYTGLPTLVAEELDADWSQIRAEGAPADAKRYNNLLWGEAQGTGGSTALANSYEQLRKAGAAARAMLVAAAAEKWQVPASEIKVSKGVVFSGNKKATFGELAADAAKQPVPADVKLKDPNDFVLIGKPAVRTDALAKSNGSAIFTQDVKLPGMLTAVVLHPPRFGATLKSFDAAKAKAVVRHELHEMGIDIRDPDQPVGTLSGGERQSVAIARAVYFGARVLILDEPTSALGVKQAGVVLKYILQARDRGVAVIFITHNPHHAYPVGDRFVILNRGQTIGTFEKDQVDRDELVRLMAGGRELAELEHELEAVKAELP